MENKIINIKISNKAVTGSTSGILTIEADRSDAGTMYDDGVYQLVFERPDEYGAASLHLIFNDSSKTFADVVLDDKNEYYLPDTLTQKRNLLLQITFVDEAESEVEYSNKLTFTLRESLKPADSSVTDVNVINRKLEARLNGVTN